MEEAALAPCPGCGGLFPSGGDGPQHPYMLGSAGCWAAYGAVLTHEYEDPILFRDIHRLTVDTYAVQHPGDPADRRAVQSVWIHVASLDAIFRHGWSHDEARKLLSRLAGRAFPSLPPAPLPWRLTVADFTSTDASEHRAHVEHWARTAHAGWLSVIGAARIDDLVLPR